MEHEFDAFSGSLSDFDVHGNLLAACGFSSRLTGLACDRFLKVYDLRMMRAITPLQVHVDPAFLRFIPTYTSRLAIISQSGMQGLSALVGEVCEPGSGCYQDKQFPRNLSVWGRSNLPLGPMVSLWFGQRLELLFFLWG